MVVIPHTVTQIANNAFASTNISDVTFEEGWYYTSNYSDYLNKTGGTAVANKDDFITYLKDSTNYLYRN